MIYNVAQVAVGGFFAGAAGELLKDSLTFPIDTVRTRLMTVGSFSEPPKPKASPTSGILYLYMHICINTHTHRSIYAYTYVHTHTYTHMCVCTATAATATASLSGEEKEDSIPPERRKGTEKQL